MTSLRHLQGHSKGDGSSDVIWAYPAGRPGNPYTGLLYSALADRGWKIDDLTLHPRGMLRSNLPAILHVHWPEQVAGTTSRGRALARLFFYAVVLVRCRLYRRPIVWTVHNLHAHDSRHIRVARAAIALTRWTANGVVFMSRVAEARFRERYLYAPPSLTIRHGDLSIEYGPTPERWVARRQLGIDPEAVLIVAFGRLRGYKNVGELLDAFQTVDDEHWRLLVTGKADVRAARALERIATRDKRILLQLNFQSSSELGTAIAASDLVCIPFSDVLHSGSAHLAASMGRPILVPDLGSLPEMQAEFTNGQVLVYSPPLAGPRLAAAVADSLRSRDNRGLKESQGWSAIAAAHADFFIDLAGVR